MVSQTWSDPMFIQGIIVCSINVHMNKVWDSSQ